MRNSLLVVFVMAILMVAMVSLGAVVNASSQVNTETVGPDNIVIMTLELEIIQDTVYSITIKPAYGIMVQSCDYHQILDENDEHITGPTFFDNINQEITFTPDNPLTGWTQLKTRMTVFDQNEPEFQFLILNADAIETASGNVNGIFPLIGNEISITGRLINVMGDTIQSGIDSAQDGDVVLVQSNIYYENLYLDKDIKIISMNELLGPTYPIGATIINGNSSGKCLTATGCTFEIVGFIIKDGDHAGNGSGISMDMCHDSIIRNCLIMDNETSAGGDGSGIYMSYSNNVSIVNVEISNNDTDRHGGGIACYNSPMVSIVNSHITDNVATKGGGIFTWNSQILVENSDIRENHASSAGGGIFIDNQTFQIYNSEFHGNTGYAGGGGIYATNSNGTIADCLIYSNTSHYGGGINISDCYTVLIQGGSVSGNNIDVMNGHGGGISCDSTGELTIARTTIGGNSGNNGAGLFIDETNTRIRNSIFRVNNGWIYDGGGIIVVEGSELELTNITMADNTGIASSIIAGDSNLLVLNSILWDPFVDFQMNLDDNSSLTVSYSDVKDGEEGIFVNGNSTFDWLEGNISEDPLFNGPQAGSYYLSEGSPCIDAGTIYYEWNGEVILDLDTGAYNSISIDQGCYESEWFTSIDSSELISEATKLLGNYPNPFNPSTTIKFNIRKQSDVKLTIYNVKGQRVQTLVDGQIDAGSHIVTWNGTDQNNNAVSSGVYFYKLTSGRYSEIKKMILSK